MCGIAGVFQLDGSRRAALDPVISRINDYQRQRGPDGSGLWSSADGDVVLGHRRLSIIDIGPGGAQPMTDVTGRWTITFNGEIYNYRAIRSDLVREGVEFHTESDTEVLINVIAKWGERGLCRLRGMYAFGLWDAVRHELWLARDPYGIKPLYVSRTGSAIWFASQARALATCAPVDTSRDPAALAGFYTWGHIPEPFSWWRGIEAFPAGHVQRLAVGKQVSPPAPFFTVEDTYCRQPLSSDVRPDLKTAVLDSVRHHLVSDVPVGLFLSAGVDSTTIAALACELGARLQTMTLAFDEYKDTANDEAPVAELVAKKLGFEHTTIRVNREKFESLVDDFFKSMDQPTIDGLNSYLTFRARWRRTVRRLSVVPANTPTAQMGAFNAVIKIPEAQPAIGLADGGAFDHLAKDSGIANAYARHCKCVSPAPRLIS
jgi:asparagine synthase (glutamine-hydrolysing)